MKEKLSQLFKKYHFIPVLLILLFSIPSFIDSVRGGFFPMHDDLQVMRQLVIEKCFQDGQIPCRWSEDMGYGYGYPLFNYYPPFPYYLGQIFRVFGIPFLDIVKILFISNFIISGLAMYLLAQQFWGRWGGVISAIFYIYAPYHALDVYVRGAMNESWGLVWFPLILWSIYKLIMSDRWFFVPLAAVSTAFLMLSHNPMLMIFTPVVAIWTLVWLVKSKNYFCLTKLTISAIWALGLAAFFTLPVIIEQKDAHVETMIIGYFNYLAHFLDLNQLFISRYWGYGESTLGPKDTMGFQLGLMHWVVALLSLLVAVKKFKQEREKAVLIFIVFFTTLFYTFLTHQRAAFIWERIDLLAYLQFPWRILAVSIFGLSFLAGSLSLLFNSKLSSKRVLSFLIPFLIIVVVFYSPYFKWQRYLENLTDEQKLSGDLWRLQVTAGIFDYLPKSAPRPPAGPPSAAAEIIQGGGEFQKVFKNSIKEEYKVRAEENVSFMINTYYFPGWKYFINNVEADPEKDKELGRPVFKLSSGEYIVKAEFKDTAVRKAGNILSSVAWLVMLALLFKIIFKKIKQFHVRSVN